MHYITVSENEMLDDITLFRLLSQAITEFVSRGALPPSHVIKQILSEVRGISFVRVEFLFIVHAYCMCRGLVLVLWLDRVL